MFGTKSTKLSETITVPPDHYGNVAGFVRSKLRNMFVDTCCPLLGIGTDIKNADTQSVVLDAESGDSVTTVNFVLKHIKPEVGDVIERPLENKDQEDVVEYDYSDLISPKIIVSYDGFNDKDFLYEITLCQYIDLYSNLLPDSSVRFVCIASPKTR